MKNYIKKMIPAIIIAFSFSFMLFISEPITMYAANVDDFWFGFTTLLKSNSIVFLAAFLGMIFISSLAYLLDNIFKKKNVFNVFIILFSSCFIYLYIQGNYFSGNLPVLDGSPIVWSSYKLQGTISIILITLILISNIILYLKTKESYLKIMSFIPAAIVVMITVGLIPSLLNNKQLYVKKGVYASTTKNINTLSKNNNFLILLVDMLDSKTFDKVLKNNNKENLFKDFTYYPDTLSAYPFTRESIPFILSGKWYEAKQPFYKYYNDAMNNSSLLKKLHKKGYDVNIYEQDLLWTSSKSLETDNIQIVNNDINLKCFVRQESKYLLFKYLPFQLKKYSKIESMDYLDCRKETMEIDNIFDSDNKKTYDVLDKINLQNDNYFHFLHIDGGHYPWDTNKNFEKIENGTYEDKIESSLNVIEKYLDRIKKSGMYDNSIIIVLADHGNNGYDPIGRQNPSLYIKGFNEKHSKMNVSNIKVSYDDLNKYIYDDLLNGKKSVDLLSFIKPDRKRRFIWYKDYDKMYEQTLDGHAWETKKLTNTGKRYER